MKRYNVSWHSPDCAWSLDRGYYSHNIIVEASSEEEIPNILAKFCSCKVSDIELGPLYEIKPLDSTPKSKGLSREEIKETIALIQQHKDLQEYGVVINRT